jgi:general secretion pathway protein F
VSQRVLLARERVVQGAPLTAALATENTCTATVLRLARAGEESGNLAEMLTHAATLEQERATRNLKSVIRLIEPMLILVVGGLVAFVAAALLQAVYNVRPGV